MSYCVLLYVDLTEEGVRKRDEAELEAIERVNMTHERMI